MADSQKFPLAKFPLTLAGFEKNRLFFAKVSSRKILLFIQVVFTNPNCVVIVKG